MGPSRAEVKGAEPAPLRKSLENAAHALGQSDLNPSKVIIDNHDISDKWHLANAERLTHGGSAEGRALDVRAKDPTQIQLRSQIFPDCSLDGAVLEVGCGTGYELGLRIYGYLTKNFHSTFHCDTSLVP